MFAIIKDSYVLFFKKLPLWIAFILPMAIFSYIDDLFWAGKGENWSLKILGLMIFAATELAIYRKAMEIELGGAVKAILKAIFLIVFQIVMGIVMLLPVYVFMHIAQHHQIMSFSYYALSLLVNVLLGGWIFAKANALVPLVIAGEKVDFSKFKEFSKGSYVAWALVSLLVYFPYVASYYLIECVWLNTILTSVFVAVFCLFNSVYYKAKNK